MNDDLGRALYELRAAINNLNRLTIPDHQAADLLGEVKHLRGRLQEWENALLKESPTSTGDAYRIVDAYRPAKWSFNLHRIIKDTEAALNTDRASALGYLMDAGVLQVTNKSAVEQFMRRNDIMFKQVPHEIGLHPHEEAHVGRVAGDRYSKLEAIPVEKTSEVGF